VPALAVILGIKARAIAKSTPTKGAGLATAAVVIAGIVTAGVFVFQVFAIDPHGFRRVQFGWLLALIGELPLNCEN